MRQDTEGSMTRKEYFAQELRKAPAAKNFHNLTVYWLTFNFVLSELLDSLLWEILLLFFNNIYGIRQLIWARVYVRNSVRVQGDENEWGFGQVLALLLLALPVLAAAEARRGLSDRGHDRESSRAPLISLPAPIAVSENDNNFSNDDLALSQPPQAAPEGQPIPQSESAYNFPHFWTIFAGLILYTLATMIVVAYYLAWHIGPRTYPGIEAGLAMTGILLLATIGPLYHDFRRLKGSL
ncbi:hypothetical protein ACLMJK_007092 [Lecanora helva]